MIDTNDGAGGDREIEIEREDDRPSGDAGRSTTDGSRRATVGDRDAERSGVGDGYGRAPERRLEDELGRIDLMTTPEGYVEGRVTGLSAVDRTTVRLAVTLPHDRTVAFDLEKPIPWSDEFLLARLVEDVGYDAASIGHLLGEPVYLARTDVEREEGIDWWTLSPQSATEAVLASLGVGTAETEPEWRLVDPLERSAKAEGGLLNYLFAAGATALIVVGCALAVLGAVFGATGAVLSAGAVAYAVPGLALVLTGLLGLLARDTLSGE